MFPWATRQAIIREREEAKRVVREGKAPPPRQFDHSWLSRLLRKIEGYFWRTD